MGNAELIKTIMQELCILYNEKPTPTLAKIWLEVFGDWTKESLESARIRCIKEWRYSYMPKPAQFSDFRCGNQEPKEKEPVKRLTFDQLQAARAAKERAFRVANGKQTQEDLEYIQKLKARG